MKICYVALLKLMPSKVKLISKNMGFDDYDCEDMLQVLCSRPHYKRAQKGWCVILQHFLIWQCFLESVNGIYLRHLISSRNYCNHLFGTETERALKKILFTKIGQVQSNVAPYF